MSSFDEDFEAFEFDEDDEGELSFDDEDIIGLDELELEEDEDELDEDDLDE